MPTLTTTQINALQTKITNGDITGFYTDLANYGDAYGTLALSQTNNTGWQAQLSNRFAASGAADNSIVLTYGSTAWTNLNQDLASRYLDAYQNNSNSTPTWNTVQQLHNDGYDFAGLDANDWLPNKLLDDSGNPGALWSDLLANQGTSDLWGDAFVVAASGGSLLFGPYLIYEMLANQSGIDPADIEFARSLLNAMANMGEAALQDMLSDFTGNGVVTDLIETLLDLPRVPADPAGHLPANDTIPTPDERPLGAYVPDVTAPFGDAEQAASPLVLDIDGSGTIELTALNSAGSVYWDIDEDGFREASGWITGGDGLLCIDLNSDGIINDHGELFGGTNGYVTLDAYDTNSNNTITSADTQFGDLRVWIDSNADGYSQAAELHTLTSLGITSIATTYSNVNYEIAGNEIKYESTFVMNGNTYTSVDAFFTYDNTNTIYADDFTFDLRTVFLPTLRGYGDLPDLHIAMSLNEGLLDLVQDFASLDRSEIMQAAFNPTDGAIQDILFRWAGVDGVSSTSRGDYIDARVLEFLEAFVGKGFLQGGGPNPGGLEPAEHLMEAWVNAFNAFANRLVFQASGAEEIFEGAVIYNPVADSVEGATGIDLDAIEDWLAAAEGWTAQFNTACFIVNVIDETIGIANLSSPDQSGLEALLPVGATLDALTNKLFDYGYIDGTSGDDLILASSGEDLVYGHEGADILIGSEDGDYLAGGAGDDTYVIAAGSGTDTVNENLGEGADTIVLSGYSANDVRMWTDGSGNLHIVNRADSADHATFSGGTTEVAGTFSEADIGSFFEQLIYQDGATLNLSNALSIEGSSTAEYLYGTAYNDEITAMDGDDVVYGNRGNDALFGGDGGDNLYGGDGDDAVEGGAGNDELAGESGTDTLSYASAASGITINLATATAQNTGGAGTDTISSFENLVGSAFNDTLTGTSSSNVIEGGSGNDTINAQGGTDTLTYANASGAVTVNLATATAQNTGGAGTDTISNFENLTGSAFGDTLTGSTAANVINGGDGDDTAQGGAGNDTLIGGNGSDLVSFTSAGSAVTVNLATLTAQNTGGAGTDTISGFENVTGSAFNDTLTGDGGDNVITGAAGNDTLNGAGGIDTLSYANAGSAITMNLSTATAQVTGGAGTDTVSNFENLTGSAHNDTLTGTSSANTIIGNAGNDTINAGGGNDFLYGGAGTDTLSGSTGSDTFVFEAAFALSASDTITDFSTAAVDVIDLSDILASYDPLDDAISDFVRITDNGTNSFLSVDADGGGNSFTQVAQLSGVTNLAGGATATELELQAMITNGTLLAA